MGSSDIEALWGWGKMQKIQIPAQIRLKVIFKEPKQVPKTEQLCPLVSLAPLNESWNWFFKKWHSDQRIRLATLSRLSFFLPPSPKIGANCGIECRWTPSCPAVWESAPLQTGCLSEALTSSALIALTGSGWLFYLCFFIYFFSLTESSLWLIWRLAVRSIRLAMVKTDTKRLFVFAHARSHACARFVL